MAFIGTFSRALLESATAVYYGGNPVTVLDAFGDLVVGDTPPPAPTTTGTIADRSYQIGSGPYTIDLATKFSGAGTYAVSPANANLSLSGAVLTITPTAALAETTITVVGKNGGGDSAPLTFKLTVTALVPTITTPLPDQSLNTGSATVTIQLDNHFSGAASYTVLPAGQGATIIGRNLVLSTTAVRSLEITVTAKNTTGQEVSDTFLFAVAQLQQGPAVTAVPTISGSPTLGSTLSRTAGTATGIPAPARVTQWLVDGEVQAANGNSFDTTGLAEGDVITTRDVWTNTIGGVVQTATGTSEAVTLTLAVVLEITATITPDPLQSNKPGSITFDIVPETVGGNVALTPSGDEMTYTFLAPEFGNVQISASAGGYEPFLATYPVDTETIEAIVAPVQTATYAGQKISDIPGITTALQASNYTRTGRTINAPELRKNGQPTTLSESLAKNDVVDVLVTDNQGGSEIFPLSTTQYSVEITPLSGGLYRAIDDNPLLPDDLLFPVSYLGVTTQTSQARLAAGPESHKHISIVKETNGDYTATPGWWFTKLENCDVNLTHQWLKNGSPILNATGLTLAHIADFDGATISCQETGTESVGGKFRTRASNGISNADVTAPVISGQSHNTETNTYSYSTTKPGTLYWTSFISGGAVPTVNAQGVWSGPYINTGSITLQTAGAKTFTPTVASVAADRLVFAIVDAAGNISNHINLPYTQKAAAGEAAKVPVSLSADYYNATLTKDQTFANVDLGAPDPRRDIVFGVVNRGNGIKPATLDVVVDGETIPASLIVQRGTNDTTHDSAMSFFKARVPNGNLATVNIHHPSQPMSHCRLSVMRGININTADAFSSNAYVTDSIPNPDVQSITINLAGQTPGRTVIALGMSVNNDTHVWTGATKVYQLITSATSVPSSLAVGTIEAATHQVVMSRNTNSTGQMGLVGFTVGAAA